MENSWSLLKRTLSARYVSGEPFHLYRYLDEQALRFNERKSDDGQWFIIVAWQFEWKPIMYWTATGKESAAGAVAGRGYHMVWTDRKKTRQRNAKTASLKPLRMP